MSCPLSATHSKVWLQDPSCKIPLSNKPWVSLPLSPGSFSGLESGQLQGLQGAIQLRDDHEMLEFCLEMFQLNKEFRTLTTQTGYTSSLFLLCPKAN